MEVVLLVWSPCTVVNGRRPFLSALAETRWVLFQGWRLSFGFCADVECGSSLISPWRWSSLTVSSNPRPTVLGARPRPLGVRRWLISFVGTSVYFGSVQSLCAMEFSRTWGRWHLDGLALSDDRQRSRQAALVSKGTKGMHVILFFLGPFVQIGWDNCPLYPVTYLYFYDSLYAFLNFNIGIFYKKTCFVPKS